MSAVLTPRSDSQFRAPSFLTPRRRPATSYQRTGPLLLPRLRTPSDSAPNSKPSSARGRRTAPSLDVQLALKSLFSAYDQDCSGHIDLDEFVQAQRLVGNALGTGVDARAAVAHFMDMSLGHSVCYAEFAVWMLRLFSQHLDSDQEVANALRWSAQTIVAARGRDDSIGTAVSSPSKPKSSRRATPRVADKPKGGGQSTLRRGFVENPVELTRDIDEFQAFHQGEEISSGEEEKKELQWARAVVQCDSEIAKLTTQLRQIRRRCRAAGPGSVAAGLQGREEELRGQLQCLWAQKAKDRRGKLVLQGEVVACGKKVRGAQLSLLLGNMVRASVTSTCTGYFEHRLRQPKLGQSMQLSAEKEGFALASKHVGGDGARQVRFELLPLSVSETFEADPKSRDVVSFREPRSGTLFELRVDGIRKDDAPFAGRVRFRAAVVDPASPADIRAMPALVGRTLGGAMTSLLLLACVYFELKDAADGTDLHYIPARGGVRVSLELPPGISDRLPRPPRPPSLWHYNREAACWDQTLQVLLVNGSELPPPVVQDELAETPMALLEPVLLEQAVEEMRLQEGRQKVNEQRKLESQDPICTCGFESKRAIMPLLRRRCKGLSLADPPKRLFAAVHDDGTRTSLCFPYVKKDDLERSVEKARQHPELWLSQHLARLVQVLGRPSEAGRDPMGSSAFFKNEGPHIVPALRHVAAWLMERARFVDERTNERLEEVDPRLLELKVLEQIVGLFAHPQGQAASEAPGPTMEEMARALEEHSGDVANAFLAVAAAQARRSEVAAVRRALAARDCRYQARYSVVDDALRAAAGDTERAVELLLVDPVVESRFKVNKFKDDLLDVFPIARFTTQELRSILSDADGDIEAAVESLVKDPATKDTAERPLETWDHMLTDPAKPTSFTFYSVLNGWTSVMAPNRQEQPEHVPQLATDRCLEFFPVAPRPFGAAGDTSLVVGAIDESLEAARVAASGMAYCGVDVAESLQPDGTFCLSTLGCSLFEVKAARKDGTECCSVGPLRAAPHGQVTNLGLISHSRRSDNGLFKNAVVESGTVQVILPALEFPPHGAGGGQRGLWSHWLGSWTWALDSTFVDELRGQDRIPHEVGELFSLELVPERPGPGGFAKVRVVMGPWTGAGRPKRDRTFTARISSPHSERRGAVSFTARFDYDGEGLSCAPSAGEVAFVWDDARRAGVVPYKVQIRRVGAGLGSMERCTCFSEDEYDEDADEGEQEEQEGQAENECAEQASVGAAAAAAGNIIA